MSIRKYEKNKQTNKKKKYNFYEPNAIQEDSANKNRVAPLERGGSSYKKNNRDGNNFDKKAKNEYRVRRAPHAPVAPLLLKICIFFTKLKILKRK